MKYEVVVAREKLENAVRVLAGLFDRPNGSGDKAGSTDALISMSDGELHIDLPGAAVSIDAQGQWDGRIIVPSAFVVALSKAVFGPEQISIRVDGERLRVGNASHTCRAEADVGEIQRIGRNGEMRDEFFAEQAELRQSQLALQPDTTVIDILVMCRKCTMEELEAAGLAAVVQAATRSLLESVNDLMVRPKQPLKLGRDSVPDMTDLLARLWPDEDELWAMGYKKVRWPERTPGEMVSFSDSEVETHNGDFWFKPTAMLQTNWALIDRNSEGVTVRFISDSSGVFDEIQFDSSDTAESALSRNGFKRYADDPEAQQILSVPTPPFRWREHPNGRIYSSGRYWIGLQ